MTSSNVSNLLVQVGTVDNIPKPDKQPEVKNVGDLFAKTLQNVSGISTAKDSAPDINASEKSIETTKANLDKNPVKKEIKQDNAAEKTDVIEKVEAVVNEVKEVIKDELDVTDEELELAMENLGLLTIDLLDPQNLAKLVTELTGQEDSINLIMSDEFADILSTVNDLTKQLFADTGQALPEIKELLIQMEPVEAPEYIDLKTIEDVNLNPVDVAPKETIPVEEQPDFAEALEPQIKESVKPVVTEEVIKPEVKPEITETVEEPVVALKQDNEGEMAKNQDETFSQKDEKPVFKPADVENTKVEIKHDNVNPMVQAKPEIQFTPEEQVVELPTGETVKASDIANQFIEQARVLTSTEATTMELTLNPEGLGKIFLEVTQKGNEITAKIFTENDAVKQALESQMANLKTEFNQNSTKVTSIEVSVGTHEFERNLDENGREDSRREEGREQSSKRRGRIDINSLDDLTGLMSDEEMLIAQMMRDNGGTLDFMA